MKMAEKVSRSHEGRTVQMSSVVLRLAFAASLLPLLAGGCASPEPGSASPVAAKSTAAAPAPVRAASAAHVRPAPTIAEPTVIEIQNGIQLAQVGVAASGGLVDVRFRVLDAAKAKALLSNQANMPMLVAGDRPPVMPPHHALRGARLSQGQLFYILYPNSRGLIQPGTEVSVAWGDVRLGPVTAQ
jgi:hypothetical protein